MSDYDLQRELAVLAIKVQKARRGLEEVRAEERAFLEEREKKALEVVEQARREAAGAIEETKQYLEAVEQMGKIATSIIEDLEKTRQELKDGREAFVKASDKATERLSEDRKEISRIRQELKAQREGIEKENEQSRALRETVKKEQEKVTKDRKKLGRAIEIAKKYGSRS